MNHLRNLILLMIFLSQTAGCDYQKADTENFSENGDEIIQVNYGTSFGFCIGYCYRELIVMPTELKYRSKDREGELPEIVCTRQFSIEKYNEILKTIDLAAFLDLDEIIGCPDCADGGAEWIEITTRNTVYKVTFEYMNEPGELSDYINFFRDHMEYFSDCGQ